MITPESELVQQARTGDTTAFRELIERYKTTVHRIAYHICGNADDARDIAQEAFIRIYRQFGRYDASRPFVAWISRITINLAIDHHRKQRTTRTVPLDDVTEAMTAAPGHYQPDRQMERREFAGAVEQICAGLTAQQRAAFVLRDIQEFSTAETARIMNCADSTVRVHLAAARRRIRDELHTHYPGQFPGNGHTTTESTP